MVLTAMIASCRQLGKICILICLGLFVMGSLGSAIFNPNVDARFTGLYEDGFNLYANFKSPYGAMQLMFIAATGDAWAGLLEEALSVSIGRDGQEYR